MIVKGLLKFGYQLRKNSIFKTVTYVAVFHFKGSDKLWHGNRQIAGAYAVIFIFDIML